MPHWLAMRGTPPHRLEPGVDLTIGRGRDCDISIYSSLLSREHARIRWERGQPVLFDCDSLNGVFMGPDRIHRRELRDGDLIRMGDNLFLFRECHAAPPILDDDFPQPGEVDPTPDDYEPGSETRLYSRTAALQQKVFDYDELLWLLERVKPWRAQACDAWLSEATAALWYDHQQPARRDDALYELLRTGVLAPLDHEQPLPRAPRELAAVCALTKRGERLRALLDGRKVHWNEMAALRYRTRQGPIFKALRSVARAYRPSTGLAGLRVPDVVYELRTIYAADMPPATLELELRRLLCLGVFWPTSAAKGAAWFPASWDAPPLEIAARGLAMLEGFRLEE